ncbi:hypothetical protein [Ramlibacter rhizophilus]|uniref:Uncharacterized protein n=1 Tax=Ramlibacter rhizophilus TaxID=1781167 RepID=A0A4Z0BRQ2_9BURK|nr:hypothetical protein [Ramlibacter rhizophilus]TFZ01080.1 hypothetical protein EZ242_06705 [Ramlibacter rhizophilus]
MTPADYRIESNLPLSGRLLPMGGSKQVLVGDRGLAVALAAKNFVPASGHEIRVVHVPTGEIVFRKHEAQAEALTDEV